MKSGGSSQPFALGKESGKVSEGRFAPGLKVRGPQSPVLADVGASLRQAGSSCGPLHGWFLVKEMAHGSEDHGHIEAVGSGDDVRVA